MKNIAIIPARGGSKGIPRKNIRMLNGKPLIAYTIEAALNSKYIHEVIVSTDDEEIGIVAKKYGARIINRPPELATDEVPLDPVINNVVEQVESSGDKIDVVITIQPTSPLLKSNTIDSVVKELIDNGFDTVLTAVDDRHLSWTKEDNRFVPNYKERKNRQYLPHEYKETGAVLATRRRFVTESKRIGNNVSLYEVSQYESVDIDSPMDWWVAEKLLRRKRVLIRVDGYEQIGLGHIYRALTLANYIIDHEIIFLMDAKHKLGISQVEAQNFKIETFEGNPLEKIKELEPEIIINDILNTSVPYIQSLKDMGIAVYNFEDLGEGAEIADGVFNALYPGTVPSENFYTGEKYYCPRMEFMDINKKEIREQVSNILITFGGTDPNNLTLKTLNSIVNSEREFSITIIVGPGYAHLDHLMSEIKKHPKKIDVFKQVKNMADHMQNADVIFSSAGRTMYEIAMVGTPAIIIAQNNREMTHLFGHNYNGFINLGIHSEVSETDIRKTLDKLIGNHDLRKLMNKRMYKHNLKDGLKRVYSIIFEEMKGEK